MNFDIDRYQGINQRAQTWGLTGYMRAEWHDARLEFNGTASRASHLTLFPAQAAQVWQPDIYFKNYVSASSISGTDGYGESLTIFPDGRVVRSQQRSFTFACALHLDELPFDVQQVECTAELPLPLPLPLPLTLPLTLTLTLTLTITSATGRWGCTPRRSTRCMCTGKTIPMRWGRGTRNAARRSGQLSLCSRRTIRLCGLASAPTPMPRHR